MIEEIAMELIHSRMIGYCKAMLVFHRESKIQFVGMMDCAAWKYPMDCLHDDGLSPNLDLEPSIFE